MTPMSRRRWSRATRSRCSRTLTLATTNTSKASGNGHGSIAVVRRRESLLVRASHADKERSTRDAVVPVSSLHEGIVAGMRLPLREHPGVSTSPTLARGDRFRAESGRDHNFKRRRDHGAKRRAGLCIASSQSAVGSETPCEP